MSLLFFKRVLANPLRIGYVCPSSPFLIRQLLKKLDMSHPRVIVELGAGEGCYTRRIAKTMHPNSRLIAFELDHELAAHLQKQFKDDKRITILERDALHLPEELKKLGIASCDYVISGLPFSVMPPEVKQGIVSGVYSVLSSKSEFLVYQLTHELKAYAQDFDRSESEHCLFNIPPIYITRYFKSTRNSSDSSAGLPGLESAAG